MTQPRLSLPLVLLALLGPAAALAGPTAADYLRGTTPAHNAHNAAGKEADARFFEVQGVPANLVFLLDNSGSMKWLVMPPDKVRGQGTGCDNDFYDNLDGGSFSRSKSYPPADPTFPDLFHPDGYYREGDWDDSGATELTLDQACNYGKDWRGNPNQTSRDCKKCLDPAQDNKGYFLDPTGGSRDIFTGKFLNFYPPRFVTARAVLKKVIANTDDTRVRMGLFTFDGNRGAKKVADLAPNCTQLLNSADDAWATARTNLINKLNDTANCNDRWGDTRNSVCFNTSTPLAEALLDVGQYFTSNTSVFDTWFGTGWYDSGVANPGLNTEDRPFCYGCQVSSVVIITDGAPSLDNCMPDCIKAQKVDCVGCNTQDGACLSNDSSCPNRCTNKGTCTKGGKSDCCVNGANYLDDVAKWLYENDLQTVKPTSTAWSSDGRQKLVTYTVGFALTHPLLSNAATVGGGKYSNANDAASLEDALDKVINDVNKRATTFGVSSISTLQTNSGISAVVPRFVPGTGDEEWKGYLFRFNVVNELINGCLPTGPDDEPHVMDMNRDHDCNDLLYTDRDDDVVEEDALTGLFVKRGTNQRAIPIWEAGRELTYRTTTYVDQWDTTKQAWVPSEARDDQAPDVRNIWTVIDSNADGRLDSKDDMVEFTETNAARLLPYFGFGLDVTNEPFCSSTYTTLGDTTLPLDQWGEECAKVIIRHFRGKRATAADPLIRQQTREWLLADIFHSTPIEVLPPVPAGLVCSDIFDRQCVPTLYRQGTDEAASKDARTAYQEFREGSYCGSGKTCEERRQLVLVGSNGGFLHAFDYGGKASGDRDPYTGMFPSTNGTGKERWAFIPPDLLGLLRHHVGKHAYTMDGTPMVREVWVDGDRLSDGDGKKSAGEFRTVAVMGERSGGVHYFALDITQNVDTQTKPQPRFLWMWPQPNDPLAARVGDSWNQYYPKPPPIGPVLLDASTTGNPGFSHKYRVPTGSGTAATFDEKTAQVQERWVVGLAGGYDRALLRGRGFSMVDAWTGDTLWEAFHDPAASDLRQSLEYPWVAAMALLDVGHGDSIIEKAADGYFDTFTVGDMGGNLWMGRMYVPGTVSGGKVTNWAFGRAFQTEKEDDQSMKRRRPFMVMTESAMQYNGFVRTLAGTGDRAALLDKDAGECSLDSPYECILMGCKVVMTLSSKNAPADEWLTSTTWKDGKVTSHTRQKLTGCTDLAAFRPREAACFKGCTDTTCDATSGYPTALGRDACLGQARTASQASSCTEADKDQALTLSMRVSQCSALTTTATVGTVLDRVVRAGCTTTATGVLQCETDTLSPGDGFIRWKSTSGLAPHRFFQVHTFGGGPNNRVFNDATSAGTFDSGRLTESELVSLGSVSTPSASLATEGGEGWYIRYDRMDERTASAATIVQGYDGARLCAVWNTLTPGSVGTICGGAGSQTARLLQGELLTGDDTCLLSFGSNTRFVARSALVPPPPPTKVVGIGAGKLVTGMVLAEPGADPLMVSGNVQRDLMQASYHLELSPQEHVCRHEKVVAACGQ